MIGVMGRASDSDHPCVTNKLFALLLFVQHKVSPVGTIKYHNRARAEITAKNILNF